MTTVIFPFHNVNRNVLEFAVPKTWWKLAGSRMLTASLSLLPLGCGRSSTLCDTRFNALTIVPLDLAFVSGLIYKETYRQRRSFATSLSSLHWRTRELNVVE